MIQRVQTIFLLVIVLGMGAFLGLPVWEKVSTTSDQSIYLTSTKITHQINNVQSQIEPVYQYALLAVLIGGIALFAIFQFRNRLLQSALCAANSIVMTALLALVVYQTMFKLGKLFEPEAPGSYEYGFYGLVVAMLANLLANRFIRRDEKMVKESNRFR
jgi:glucan phosphoethanolaminetransferase (alkaline phosphatase superfamily)